ncbi:HmuY family protein [Flavobacterium terrae]|uniref:HmuY protein n=1 Tax=Flavobacterium terrae TaxID=415425 RepID=A0A1M6FUA7_9FLAO|nr:HmuY family protein [Flavobacterium terrae]SHJ01209.1 HmuY protein [Flavobacterium terrae]
MKNLLKLASALIVLLFASCSSDDQETVIQSQSLQTKKVSNLYAPQSGGQGQPVSGDFVKFSFSTGEIVTSGDNWDIAFRGTSIIVNGGYSGTGEPAKNGNVLLATVSNTLSGVTEAPSDDSFKQDAQSAYAIPTGSGNGWYTYNPTNHVIAPIAGRVFVIKTANGKYAKFEILSYYQNAPANPLGTEPSKYFTFNYVYQPDGSKKF